MKRVSKTPSLPTPAQEGPVEPPKARGALWVYFVMLSFVVVTAFVVVVFSIVDNGTEVTEGAEGTKDVEEKLYSHFSVVTPIAQSDHYTGSVDECAFAIKTDISTLPVPTSPERIAESVYLLLNIEINDAPEYAEDSTGEETEQDDAFTRDFARLKRLVGIADEHNIPLTIGLQPPFTDRLQRQGVSELKSWSEYGHEIAIRYDGATRETPYGQWLSSLHDLQNQLEELCNCEVTSWSGGDDYLGIFDVANELGFSATYGWSEEEQNIPEAFAVMNPWMPVSGGSAEALKQFDPDGTIVFLPSGVYPAHCVGSDNIAFPLSADNFIYTTSALYETLESAVDKKVNVFIASLSLNGFAQVSDDEVEFTVFDTWLTEIIDPLIARRWLKPSTVYEAARAYELWLTTVAGTLIPVFIEESVDE